LRVRALASTTLWRPHDALPLDILMVSPAVALVMHVWTEAESGVVVHVGEEPVQAARVEVAINRRSNRRFISFQLSFCLAGRPKGCGEKDLV